MKTKEQQGFRRLGRRAFGLQVLMLVLVMLIGKPDDVGQR